MNTMHKECSTQSARLAPAAGQQTAACMKCMPHGQMEAVDDLQAALSRFKRLFGLGLAPVMCQRDTGEFYVCHANPSVVR